MPTTEAAPVELEQLAARRRRSGEDQSLPAPVQVVAIGSNRLMLWEHAP